MANKKVNLIISLKDGVSAKLTKIKAGMAKLSTSMRKMASVGKSAFKAIGVAAAAASAPLLLLGKAIKTAFNFETLRTQIQVLVGSVGEAGRVFDELKKFSAETPFEIKGIVAAYRQLKNFTGEALSTRKGMTLVGDAAAATSSDFQETAFWTGRLYSALKNGNPFLDSVGAMERMGIVGGELRGKLTQMTSAGASMGEMWALVEGNLKKFEGGMSKLSKTGNGLISTLKDNWTIAVATFGEAFTESAKGGITTLIETIKKLVDNGTITAWAEQAKSGLDAVIETVKILTGQDANARSEVLGKIGRLIVAVFKDAAMGAVAIMAKYAPIIGDAIGGAIKSGMVGSKEDKLTKQEEESVNARAREFASDTGANASEFRRHRAGLIKQAEQEKKMARLQGEGAGLEGLLGGNAFANTKMAIADVGLSLGGADATASKEPRERMAGLRPLTDLSAVIRPTTNLSGDVANTIGGGIDGGGGSSDMLKRLVASSEAQTKILTDRLGGVGGE